ncbi:MAG: hypothetical protein KDD61_12185 [Bdellovibrionales bacterium]|nr:hypothetical protein [Bdellovibrionales bacterium]
MTEGRQCPVCGNIGKLRSINAGMKLALQQAGGEADIPPEACMDCYDDLNSRVSHGAKLRAEIVQKQKNKEAMWKSRVKLVKKARILMGQKAFVEAANHYEKYLRVLEVAHDLQKGGLNPEVFSKSKKSKELTVVTSTYWDLFRIYDRSPRTVDKMRSTGKKLAQFVRYSSIYPDIMKKADSFQRTAKHKNIVKDFIKDAGGKKGGCYIATSCFDDPFCWQISVLRLFRDRILKKSSWGRWFIYYYYRTSPAIVQWVSDKPKIRLILSQVIGFLVKLASLSLKRTSGS